MKKTKYAKKIQYENLKYNMIKWKYWIQMKMSVGKKRKDRNFSYSIYENSGIHLDDQNNLPDPLYFKPTDIVLYDLIQKKDLDLAKKGLVKLFKKCYTHKYILAGTEEKNIDNLIDNLDQTLHSGQSWYNVGIFDFGYDKEIDRYVHHFTVRFHNFSSSYAAVEMRVELTNQFKEEIVSFIKTQYKKPGMQLHKHWERNKSKSGARIGYGISTGTFSECAKSRLIYEQLELVKHIFLDKICKYLPIMQYKINKEIYGINVFETNITPDNKLEPSVYAALGINDWNGFNLSLAERIYVSTSTLPTTEEYRTDMMFIYNPELITNWKVYGTARNKVLSRFAEGYMFDLYRVIILKNLGLYYMDIISRYRNMVNDCKNNTRYQKKLLELKYNFSRDFYDFEKINDELPAEAELDRVNRLLEKNVFSKNSIYIGRHPYKSFTEKPRWIWAQVKSNYGEIERDLNRKIQISSELTSYSREKSNRKITFYQFILAILTFILLIFPDKATEIAELLKNVWSTLIVP